MRPIVMLGLLALNGCAAMSDPTSFWYTPPLSAQEQCEMDHGRWTTVTPHDANGQPSGPATSQCETHTR